MQTSKHHNELDEHGIGYCSVPMFRFGGEAGFCDKPAYRVPPPSKWIRNYCQGGIEQRMDGRYSGYVPALACIGHGGPLSRVFMDGDSWCAVFPDFINLQESPAGFGTSPEEARMDLKKLTGRETK